MALAVLSAAGPAGAFGLVRPLPAILALLGLLLAAGAGARLVSGWGRSGPRRAGGAAGAGGWC